MEHPFNELEDSFNHLLREGFEQLETVAGQKKLIGFTDSLGNIIRREVRVIWSTEALGIMPVTAVDGSVYFTADRLMTIREKDLWGRIPKPLTDVIEVDGTIYRIIHVIPDYGTYQLLLRRNA